MNIENIKIIITHSFYIIGVILGIILTLSSVFNFKKLIIGSILHNKFKNKKIY